MHQDDILRWVLAVALALASGLVGWLLRRLVAGRLAKLVRGTDSDLDDAILHAVSPHVPLWLGAIGAIIGVRYAQVSAGVVEQADRLTLAVFLSSVTLALATFLTRMIASRSARWPGAVPATTLTQSVVRIAVIGLGLLVVLGNLGIAIAPLLTAMGVGSLAVALALQPTLSHLFAGFHITLARRIRVGDFVELEGGQQGYITDIGWRSTQIRELSNNLVVVPNSRLAEVIVRNYSMPEGEQAALVQVGVAYDSDLEEVERVTVETARETQRHVTGAVPDFEPFIRYHTLADSAINFTVILRVREFVDRYVVMHEFIKRLHLRYAEAGIQIPFPQRVVHLVSPSPREG